MPSKYTLVQEVSKGMKKLRISCLVVSVLLSLALLSFAFADQGQFGDVPVSHWAYGAIQNLAQQQIVNGFPDNTFKPELPVTREQFAVVLTTALKLPTDQRAPETFSDVPRSHWAFLYVDATKAFIPTPSNPKGSFDFNGDKPITREQVAVSLALALDLKDNPNAGRGFLQSTFKDYKNISPAYQQQVALAVYNKVMSGNPDGTFRGKGPLTRAELCALINKVLSDIEAEKKRKMTPEVTPGANVQPRVPWTLEFLFARPDITQVENFLGDVADKVYNPPNAYLVLEHRAVKSNGHSVYMNVKTVHMYVYAEDLEHFYIGDKILVQYDNNNHVKSYSFQHEAQPHENIPQVK